MTSKDDKIETVVVTTKKVKGINVREIRDGAQNTLSISPRWDKKTKGFHNKNDLICNGDELSGLPNTAVDEILGVIKTLQETGTKMSAPKGITKMSYDVPKGILSKHCPSTIAARAAR